MKFETIQKTKDDFEKLQITLSNGIPTKSNETERYMLRFSSAEPSKGLRITDLDDYILMEIIDHLGFEELLLFADLNQELRQFITNRYMIARYHIDTSIICFSVAVDEQEIRSRIIIGKMHLVLRFLRIFGHMITKLKFSGLTFTAEETKLISNYISEHCGDTLTELEIFEARCDLTANTAITFPKVTKLRITSLKELDDLQIHRIYPALEELFYATTAFASISIKQFYPNLVRFELIEHDDYLNASTIGPFLLDNPQLHSLNMNRVPTFALLKLISENLKSLTSLGIGYHSTVYRANDGNLNFPSVQYFAVTPRNSYQPLQSFPLTFDQLNSIEIWTKDYSCIPMNLFAQNLQVKSVSLPWLDGVKASRVFNEMKKTHRLEEIKMKLSTEDGVLDIFQQLTEYESLQKITFIVYDLAGSTTNRDALLAVIPQEWHLNDLGLANRMFVYDLFHITVIRNEN